MARDLPTFRARFPEMDTTSAPDATVTYWLNNAENFLSPSGWGDCFDDAVLLYAAYQIALARSRVNFAGNGGQLGAGVVTGTVVDGVTTNFATNDRTTSGTLEESILSRNIYGQEFMALREICIPGGRIAGTEAGDTFI